MSQKAPSEEGKKPQVRRGTSLNRKNEVLIDRKKRVVVTYLSDSQAEVQ
jgi:hypothetical protein